MGNREPEQQTPVAGAASAVALDDVEAGRQRFPIFDSRLPNPRAKRFVLVAGEASGDLLGADLIRDLRERYPEASFAGVGGPRMVAAGLVAWHRSDALAVMGLVEVLRHLPGLLALRRDVVRRTLDFAPDAFIGVDAPDFNLGLERRLKRRGVRTLHYVSPSVWAWREGRAAKIGRSADRVLCLFPIEPPIYARYGVDARFVGHPLADAFALEPDRAAARRALGIDAGARVLAILPGSRLGEIARLGRDFVAAARLLLRDDARLTVIAPMANAACAAAFARVLGEDSDVGEAERTRVRIIDANEGAFPSADAADPEARRLTTSQLAMIAADAILLASGTAALEAMLAKRPMVVAYRVAPMTYRIVKAFGLLKIDRYALPNVLAGRNLVPELMQDDCTPVALADALRPLLQGAAVDHALLAEFRRLHRHLKAGPGQSAAAAIAELVDATPSPSNARD